MSKEIKKTSSKRSSSSSSAQASWKLIVIFFLVGIFVGGFVTLFYNQQKDLKQDALQLVQEEQLARRPIDQKVQDYLREPGQGKPIIAEVRDVSIVKDLPRYAFAKNGDNVLLYDNLFVIYDETQDRIVSVIPRTLLGDDVTTDSSDTEDTSATDDQSDNADDSEETEDDVEAIAPEDVAVEVRNGGSIRGFAGDNATEIKTDLGYTTTAANASNKYDKNQIILLGGSEFNDAAEALQEKYDVSEILSELPDGEATSDADIVVIVVE